MEGMEGLQAFELALDGAVTAVTVGVAESIRKTSVSLFGNE